MTFVEFFIDDRFGNGNYGVWYLVGLGAAAILFALFLPRGIWGTIEDRFGIRLLPVGYRLRGVSPRRRAAPDQADA